MRFNLVFASPQNLNISPFKCFWLASSALSFSPLSASKQQSSQSILDHIANFLKFISNTQSFWFTLDTSYNHGCHLANRFRLESNDYEVLLVVAGLASYTRFGFAVKPTAWSRRHHRCHRCHCHRHHRHCFCRCLCCRRRCRRHCRRSRRRRRRCI